jgi:hypothetical protein
LKFKGCHFNIPQETLTGWSAPPLAVATALGISEVDYQLQ